jgi:hypothetical protein
VPLAGAPYREVHATPPAQAMRRRTPPPSASGAARASGRRGRPSKFGRPSQVVALTLPQEVLAALRSIHRDPAWAIVQLVERLLAQGGPSRRQPAPAPVVELVHLPRSRAMAAPFWPSPRRAGSRTWRSPSSTGWNPTPQPAPGEPSSCRRVASSAGGAATALWCSGQCASWWPRPAAPSSGACCRRSAVPSDTGGARYDAVAGGHGPPELGYIERYRPPLSTSILATCVASRTFNKRQVLTNSRDGGADSA